MGPRGRRMAGPSFWDISASNGVPHPQVGQGRVFPPRKRQGYNLAGGVWACDPDPGFYAWNRCLGVPGVSSWGPTAKATPSPRPSRLLTIKGRVRRLSTIKGLVWALGAAGWRGPSFGTYPHPTVCHTPKSERVGFFAAENAKAIALGGGVGPPMRILAFMPGIGA